MEHEDPIRYIFTFQTNFTFIRIILSFSYYLVQKVVPSVAETIQEKRFRMAVLLKNPSDTSGEIFNSIIQHSSQLLVTTDMGLGRARISFNHHFT